MHDDRELYARILKVRRPWQVMDVALHAGQGEIVIKIGLDPSAAKKCPRCGVACSGYDARKRVWRHLDTCEYRTMIHADVPRVECEEHGVVQIPVPWAEPGSGMTLLMESHIIDWLKIASIRAVSKRLNLGWDVVDGVLQRAVKRGLQRRKKLPLKKIGVDETSFQRRHEYVTVVCDMETGRVEHVCDGHGKSSLDDFYQRFTPGELLNLESVSMDMSQAYIQSTLEYVFGAVDKIAFDRFHIAKHLGDAVDKVRREEHRELMARGNDTLKKTKYIWLQNPENMEGKNLKIFKMLRNLELKVARASAMKQTARGLWDYVNVGCAMKEWNKWIRWVMRSGIEHMKRAAITVRTHLWGILNAIRHKVTNAKSESINAKIQGIKRTACGFRTRERFRNMIYFHCGQLDLYPGPGNEAHTNP